MEVIGATLNWLCFSHWSCDSRLTIPTYCHKMELGHFLAQKSAGTPCYLRIVSRLFRLLPEAIAKLDPLTSYISGIFTEVIFLPLLSSQVLLQPSSSLNLFWSLRGVLTNTATRSVRLLPGSRASTITTQPLPLPGVPCLLFHFLFFLTLSHPLRFSFSSLPLALSSRVIPFFLLLTLHLLH